MEESLRGGMGNSSADEIKVPVPTQMKCRVTHTSHLGAGENERMAESQGQSSFIIDDDYKYPVHHGLARAQKRPIYSILIGPLQVL